MGVDPGLAKTGWGIIRSAPQGYVDAGVIRTSAQMPHVRRLAVIGEEIRAVAERWKPSSACVERVFTNINPKSSLALGEARGAALATLLACRVEVIELTALQIKQSLTGAGRANKRQVAAMVARLLSISGDKFSLDETDALACALAMTPMTKLLAAAGGIRRRRRRRR